MLLGGVITAAFAQLSPAKGGTVTLDYYYNNESKPDKAGNPVRWHYVWGETDDGGVSLWGHIFDSLGVKKDSLLTAPTAANLKKTGIYIIIDPDTEKESAHPNYMNEKDAGVIYNWVKAGGVLVLLENDSANAEFARFNLLSEKFGIHFNGDSRNRVQGQNWEQGAFHIPAGHEIFRGGRKVYIKELSTLTLKSPARAVYKDGAHVIMAVARVGRGTVFAVGDPWFYNEYVNGSRLPASFQNYEAAGDLTQWLIKAANR
ncbi:unsaturated rhamnogalacturonyl hydrolase [Chitinophaga arvensicola]|uniref:Unsaturated rhamnogalacturonyl hydrolase n=2 Tax=Chitinophaga arvensicola TaxID=29529 RepID=A0A1I0RJJ1_9BACT|nr:unsaturated rhamnogalacturonyl hydrolase [Chitinophaga arvensicola]